MPSLSNPQHERFANFVAAGCSYTEAAKRAGYPAPAAPNIGSRTANLPHVSRRIAELRTLMGSDMIVPPGVRANTSRVSALEERWLAINRIFRERATLYETDPDLKNVPGGGTGFLVMRYKQFRGQCVAEKPQRVAQKTQETVSNSPHSTVANETQTVSNQTQYPDDDSPSKQDKSQSFHLLREFEVDIPLLQEIRAIERAAAEELGQISQKKESFSSSLNISLQNLPTEELNNVLRGHAGNLSAEDRKRLLAAEPELAEYLDVEGKEEVIEVKDEENKG